MQAEVSEEGAEWEYPNYNGEEREGANADGVVMEPFHFLIITTSSFNPTYEISVPQSTLIHSFSL